MRQTFQQRASGGPFGYPNFRIYFAGTALAQSSTWLLRLTQSWLVLDMTGSPAALGVLALVQFLPITLLSLPAGVIIDRINTRRMLVVAQVAIAAQAILLAALVLAGGIQYWQLLLLSIIFGTASTFDTPGRSVLVGQLVPPARVGSAIALNSTLQNGARIIGPAVGGVVIALWGTGVCLAIAAVGASLAVGGLVFLSASTFFPKRQAGRGAMLSQLWDGVRYAFSTPSIGFHLVLMAFLGTFSYNWNVVLPTLARYGLNGGPEDFGALNVAMGIGSVLGGVLLATRVHASIRQVLLSAVAYSSLVLLLSLTPGLSVALAQLLIVGVLSVLYSAGSNTMVQVESRDEFRGRVLAIFVLLWSGTTPFGSAFTGLLAEQWGVRTALAVNGSMCLVGVLVACAYLVLARRRWRHASYRTSEPATATLSD